MPTANVGLIPIPAGLDLCGSYADQQLFIQLVNLNLGYIVKLLKDVANINITIPGVPAWQITIPGITLPGFQSQPIGYGNTRPDLQDGWIGGRFPMGHPPEPVFGQGKLPGLDDFTVGGQTINIPGTDAYTVTMQLINYNVELILTQVPTLVNFIKTIPVMTYNPCTNNPQGSTSSPSNPGVQQQIQTVNQQLTTIVKGIQQGGGGGSCPTLHIPDMSNIFYSSTGFLVPVPSGFCYIEGQDGSPSGMTNTATSWRGNPGHHPEVTSGKFVPGPISLLCPIHLGLCHTLVVDVDVDIPDTSTLLNPVEASLGIAPNGVGGSILQADGSWAAAPISGPFVGHITSQPLNVSGAIGLTVDIVANNATVPMGFANPVLTLTH